MLDNVSQYIVETRTLLQDVIAPYRYSDLELLSTLNMGLMAAYRIRADLFMGLPSSSIPAYVVNDTTLVPFDAMYRTALVHYMTGHAQLRDEEDTQDSRAIALMSAFKAVLSTAGE